MKMLTVKVKSGEAQFCIYSDGSADLFKFDNQKVIDELREFMNAYQGKGNFADWVVSHQDLFNTETEKYSKKHWMGEETILTDENLTEIVGKRIRWEVPIYKHNQGHWKLGLDGGVCIINKVDMGQRRPIVEATIIEGSIIKHAFHDESTRGRIAFSDSDRSISFRIDNFPHERAI